MSKPLNIVIADNESIIRMDLREVLEEQFPQYRGRILLYCPDGAVAQGAARFAARK